MEYEHKRFGKLVVADFTQGQFEAYSKEVVGKEEEALPVFFGLVVRAAIKHGLIVEPVMKPEQIENEKPAYIKWLALNILDAIGKANNIDPLP